VSKSEAGVTTLHQGGRPKPRSLTCRCEKKKRDEGEVAVLVVGRVSPLIRTATSARPWPPSV
jgi:hypothetical protein